MSESRGPEQDPTRRIDPPMGSPDGRNDPDSPFQEGVAYPAPRSPDPTAGGAYPPGGRVGDPYEDDPYDDGADDEDAEPGYGRDLGFGLIGAVVGILLTFVVIALATADDEPAATGSGQAEAPGAESEAAIAERDEQIAELQAQITDLESQLAATDLEADERNDEFDAQREALDERVAALDARADELDERQTELDERQAALDDRQQDLEEREAALEDAGSDPADTDEGTDGDSDDGGFDVIDSDDVDQIEDAAQGVVDQILDSIRDLFGRDGE